MSIFDVLDRISGSVYHKITGTMNEDEKRNQQYAINDQIKAYKEATELSRQEISKVQDEQNVQKRMINEKQIRSLRNSYRPAGGFLNNDSSANDKFGGSSDMSNKLGV